jgi:hypothetical protein
MSYPGQTRHLCVIYSIHALETGRNHNVGRIWAVDGLGGWNTEKTEGVPPGRAVWRGQFAPK